MADATNDQQFGRLASEKQEEADALAAKGEGPAGEEPEGVGQDPRPRAGGKASEGAPPAAGDDQGDQDDLDDQDDQDDLVEQTFPASDPPGTY